MAVTAMILLVLGGPLPPALAGHVPAPDSAGVYRIPYANGTEVRVSQDHHTHSPATDRIDMRGINGTEPYSLVAAANGWVRIIVDENTVNCLPSDGCDNNYVWMEHPNGEWTKYSHVVTDSVRGDAGLTEDQFVTAGTFLGFEGDIGRTSPLNFVHLHWEVAVVDPVNPFTSDGFITGAGENRVPVVCGITDNTYVQGEEYTADDCSGRADLSVDMTTDTDPVAAGANLIYTVEVVNDGPNTASDAVVLVDLPSEASLVSTSVPCSDDPSGAILCALGDVVSNASATVDIEVDVVQHLVYLAGGPVSITGSAFATSMTLDDNMTDNDASVDTEVVAVGDLQVLDVTVFDVPADALLSEEVPVGVRNQLSNDGPSSPMNAVISIEASATPGATVTPDLIVRDEPGLGPLSVVFDDFTLRCDEPGLHTFTFTTRIEPLEAADTDPDLSNNESSADVIVECVVPIAINIRPGNQHNQIDPASDGVVPVAALTTQVGEHGLPVSFDATTIVAGTVRFGEHDTVWTGAGGASHHNELVNVRDSFELDDKTKDGDLDMVLRFRASDSGIGVADDSACMRGLYLHAGQLFAFFGCDLVTINA